MTSPYKNLKILIVDDSLAMRMLIEQLLCNCHVDQILIAEGVTKAREILESDQEIDGVILDLVLEDGSGLELAKQFKNVPKVFCTSTRDDHNTNLMYHHGWKIDKPVSLSAISRCVEYFHQMKGK